MGDGIASVRRPEPLLPSWSRDLIAAAVVVGTSWIRASGGTRTVPLAVSVALCVVIGAVLLMRRHRPLVALASVAGLGAAASAVGGYNLGALIGLMIAGYTVADRCERRTALIAMGAAAVLATAASWLQIPFRLEVPTFLATATAWGFASRARRLYLEALEERAERAERTRESEARRRVAEERLAIARDLHDTVAHQVAVVNLHAAAASAALRDRPDDAERALATIRDAARTVLAEIATLLTSLRSGSTVMPDVPRPTAVALDQIAASARRSGLEVAWQGPGSGSDLADTTSDVLGRVLQEALTNVRRHGADARVDVSVERAGDLVRLEVANAVPARPRTTEGAGYGLVGMRERLELVGGTLAAGQGTDRMWRVVATVPAAVPGPPPDPRAAAS